MMVGILAEIIRKMVELLHQQRLLLEWIVMSGNCAVPDNDNYTLLFATLKECEKKGWIELKQFGAGFNQASITDAGRIIIENRRKVSTTSPVIEKRRAVIV